MTERFEEKKYISEMSITDARMNFRIRSKTIKVKMNERSDKSHSKKLWKCHQCGNIDSQSHLLWCPFLAPVREGKTLTNDSDLIKFFIEAMKLREDNEL